MSGTNNYHDDIHFVVIIVYLNSDLHITDQSHMPLSSGSIIMDRKTCDYGKIARCTQGTKLQYQ